MVLYAIMLSLSMSHVVIVAIVLVLLFGGRKIPELMKGIGSGIKQFKNALKDDDDKHSNTDNRKN